MQRNGFSYAVETRGGQSTYTVTDGKNKLSLPIRWPFGVHAQTWVFEYEGHFYESLVSYYPKIGGVTPPWAIPPINPHTARSVRP